ncbi:2Fe-2S iron-sulfur cluster-binding protein [Pontivivens insulae]|uniref:3-chloro-4-hydroxyphenylacetate reductive dehalogenase n=1 Tax=Pontivivens insulae TaxID=1639689 RepID=A0A2R8A7T7_9RHOB|nr:reductive dehalogenase domain-containing protein [Pontivivens insulae]RED18358.1 reductive dehalogenase [Pontivivens insulae]SPF28256.1 3-chloro-4-hydroxyphenylacetate reductive dehalogenase [Pontivivens insulae]
MGMRFKSQRERPIHLGPHRLEDLARMQVADLTRVPPFQPLSYARPDAPHSIINAMRDHQAMLDAIRDGLVAKVKSAPPQDLVERANHLKSFGYFADASLVGGCLLPDQARLAEPAKNADVARLAADLRTKQTKTLASGIDLIMADLKESMEAPPATIDGHTHAMVFMVQHPREVQHDEPGAAWIQTARPQRSCLIASEIAVVIATYLRVLGFDAKAHTASAHDVDLNRLAVASGLGMVEKDDVHAPFIGPEFGLAAITTDFAFEPDLPLAGPLPKRTPQPYGKRMFRDGAHPFEKLKRVDQPTTYIDEANVPRVPKRADLFARAQFGDMGKHVQDGATGGKYVRKSAPPMGQRRALGAFVLLQDGEVAPDPVELDPQEAADLVKATCHFLGVDAVGISRCPDWTWYSHDATGAAINPPHDQAISMVIDQGFDTMEGASGDDWISVAQSMRAYLRFSLLGGVVAAQLRGLGYPAKAHTVMDGEVLQPPLMLLSGLGEVSRIGEVILNPYLGPRLKSGVVTTTLPMAHDKPIDFGLQRFCESCKKCARECPSGAITAGPKLMFNGYEIWKSDSQKCATYRITTPGGAMCGRCMKTCPWNLEGVLADAAFRWTAMKIPGSAPALAKLDDMLDRGSLNPVKKWWWDLEMEADGAYRPTDKPVNARDLQKDLDLKYEDQTLAVYPADLAPHPYPYPFPMDREKGIEAYQAMITAEEYKRRKASGETDLTPSYTAEGESPVLRVEISKAEKMAEGITKYEMRSLDGADLPAWEAGAHLDIVVAPEFLRQYSMSGDPANRSVYQIGVLNESEGRGGSALLHRIFSGGRKIFISRPINHFPLIETAPMTYLFGGGIGITPMIAMAHRLHALGQPFQLHYSGRSRATMGYMHDLAHVAWAGNVTLHVTDEGSRANLGELLSDPTDGAHVYTCGAERFMSSVMDAAQAAGIPEERRHLEYFSVPEQPDYENHPFRVRLKDGRELHVSENETLSDVLTASGIAVDVKCSDGICGVCKCGLVAGDVEHRDFVLSKAQRETSLITCQSRALHPDGLLELDI